MIPKIIHFIFGLSETFSEKPFSLFHSLCIQSFRHFHPDYEIVCHVKYAPNNEYWDNIQNFVILDNISYVPDKIFDKPIIHLEHYCDLLRLDILYQTGGIYVDIDTLCIKPFDPLLFENKCIMGIEQFGGTINGLCNAVILSPEKNEFVKLWRDSFVEFDPYDWNKMPVRKPYELSIQYPTLVSVKSQKLFFKYDWHSIIDIFNKDADRNVILEECFSIHLWESKLYNPILRHITEVDILKRNSFFTDFCHDILTKTKNS